MASQKVYSVRDNKVGSFGPIFLADNDVIATRMLNTTLRDPNVQLSMYAEDFDLYSIGYYDNTSGKIDSIDPAFVVSAVVIKNTIAGGQK